MPDKKKIIILGANGMLGKAACRLFSGHYSIFPFDLADFDIRDAEALRRSVSDIKPYMALNCAAYTNVDGCEENRELAFEVNGIAPGAVASVCREFSVYLIHFSTDYIFSGEKTSDYLEEDKPGPLNIYGQSKLEGERRIMLSGGDDLIIRTSWLYGPFGKNFVSGIIRAAEDRGELDVVNDQVGRPTFTYDLLDCVKWLTDRRITGVVHACNSGTCSWFGFAEYIMSVKGIPAEVRAITSDELKRPAKRPRNSVLSLEKLASLGYGEVRPWKDALKEYVEEYL